MFQTTSARGLLLTLLVVLMWGIQPFFMKLALVQFDVYTVSWFRLTIGAIIILFVYLRKDIKGVVKNTISYLLPLSCAGISIGANYYTFLKGIEIGGPITASILIQTGPLLLVILGVTVYRERFTLTQSLGAILACFGFTFFFFDRLNNSNQPTLQAEAAILVIVAAVTWVIFCLVQKQIGSKVSVALVNTASFLIAGLMLLPFSDLSQLLNVYSLSFLSLIILTISTVLAYTALGEAFKLLPASIVSMIISTNPFVTIIIIEILYTVGNTFFEPVPLSAIGYLGSVLAIVGVATATSRRGKN